VFERKPLFFISFSGGLSMDDQGLSGKKHWMMQ